MKTQQKNLKQQVGYYIRVRRAVLEMSQGELAEKVGISQGFLSLLEQGKRSLDLDLLERIASALQCPINQLLPPEERLREAA
jgi:transcriptional regulator with XRE-family HTH domain